MVAATISALDCFLLAGLGNDDGKSGFRCTEPMLSIYLFWSNC